jgi:hypothetical protein
MFNASDISQIGFPHALRVKQAELLDKVRPSELLLYNIISLSLLSIGWLLPVDVQLLGGV